MHPSSGDLVFMNILKGSTKTLLKLGKARLKANPLTLKLGITLVLTVTQVYVFVNLG